MTDITYPAVSECVTGVQREDGGGNMLKREGREAGSKRPTEHMAGVMVSCI